MLSFIIAVVHAGTASKEVLYKLSPRNGLGFYLGEVGLRNFFLGLFVDQLECLGASESPFLVFAKEPGHKLVECLRPGRQLALEAFLVLFEGVEGSFSAEKLVENDADGPHVSRLPSLLAG